MHDERSLTTLTGLYVAAVAAIRATVHAALVAALFAFCGALLGLLLPMVTKSSLLSLLVAPLCLGLIWGLLLIPAAREISLGTFVNDLEDSFQDLFRRLSTPVALSLGGLVLLWLLLSRPIDFRWLLGEEPLFGLALGYFLAPMLIRERVLQRLIRSMEFR